MKAVRVYLISALVSAIVAAVVSAGVALITVRYSKSIVLFHGAHQEGTAEVRWGQEMKVYYRPHFTEPPDLKFPEGLENSIRVIDQTPAYFTLKRDASGNPDSRYPVVKWRAEGEFDNNAW